MRLIYTFFAVGLSLPAPVSHTARIDVSYDSKGNKVFAAATFQAASSQDYKSVKDNFRARLDSVQNPNPFSIDFTCAAGVDSALCLKAQQGFVNSGNRIAQIIFFPQTVRVKATFRPFCSNAKNNATKVSCSLNGTLGQASPAAYFSARPTDVNNAWFFYPQALIKQVSHDIQLSYNDYDIIAEFNADFNFWFSSDPPIQPNQTDFEFVVSHEFTHGLGFDTAWSQWGSLFPNIASSLSYLAPLPFITGTGNNQTIPNFQPLTIFDKFTYDAALHPIMDTARKIYQYNLKNVDLNTFITGFEKSPSLAAAQSVYAIASAGPNQIYFKTTDSSSLTLETSFIYQPGSSIAHVDLLLYSNSADFLMVPAVQSLTGIKLDDIIAQRNKGSVNAGVYGPKTISVLSSMGYTMIGSNLQLKSVFINPNAHSSPLLSGVEKTKGGILALLALFLMI